MKKQTAVEWLWKKASDGEYLTPEDFEQAKAMEEEQIMEAHYAPKYGCFSKEYYNETYTTNNA